MSLKHLEILGSRLAARRREAQLSEHELAARARVDVGALARFERGEGGFGIAALARLARVLGIPEAQFLHTAMPEVRAPVEPMVLLKASRGADLEEGDRAFLADALRRARMFHELGEALRCPRLADPPHFGVRPPPDRDAHQDGYRLADQARSVLSPFAGEQIESLGRLLATQFNILVLYWEFGRSEVSGASCRWGPARLIVVNKSISNEGQLRFTLAHELAHHLVDLPEDFAWADERPDQRQLWSDNPPSEKRANAFAAMFLAPTRAVHSQLASPGRGVLGIDDARAKVLAIRERFGLSYSAAAWHLSNLKYFDRDTADLLEQTAPSSGPSARMEPLEPYDGLQRRAFDAYRRELISFGRMRELIGEEAALRAAAAD